MSVQTIDQRREEALAALPPHREPGMATRTGRWLRLHLVQFFAAFALLFMFIPVFVVVAFSFNNPLGKFNYTWNEFSTKAWTQVWSDSEIVTGFRIAWGGAQERYGVVPDLACYGKAISGGFPLAAVGGDADVMSVLDARARPREEVVWAMNTLNGNPICTAAGCAALDVLGAPGVYERLAAVGARLRRGILESGRRHGLPVQAPGEDAVFGVRFTERTPLRTWLDLTTADKDLGWRWALECLRRGLIVNPNEKFYISIAHTEADVDESLERIDDAFAAIARR